MDEASSDAVSAPLGTCDCLPELVKAMPTEFMLLNRNKTNNFIWGELDSGELSFIVENRPRDGKGCPGSWLFAAMMKHFGSSVMAVRGSWTYGDNLAHVNTLTAGSGTSMDAAARQTWTGKRCAEWDFFFVEVLNVVGTPGHYISVQVRFTKQ